MTRTSMVIDPGVQAEIERRTKPGFCDLMWVEPFSVGGFLGAWVDSKIAGPGPLVMVYEGRESLHRRFGTNLEQILVAANIREGQRVLVKRERF